MPRIQPRRSVLYMPASNARALDKAKQVAADALILDLEDSVAPDAKMTARAQAAAAIASRKDYGRKELVIRVNAPDTIWFEDDLAAAIAAEPDAILIPKISDADMLAVIGRKLDRKSTRLNSSHPSISRMPSSA